jgi:translation initiation factor 2 subunit 1
LELYEKIGWPLSKKYGHMLDAFKLSITNPDVVCPSRFVGREEMQALTS